MASTRMTQTKLVQELAGGCDVSNKVARAMLDKLAATAVAEVKKNGVAAQASCATTSAPTMARSRCAWDPLPILGRGANRDIAGKTCHLDFLT